MCRSCKVAQVVPVLYLQAFSTEDLAPVLAGFFRRTLAVRLDDLLVDGGVAGRARLLCH